MNKKLKPNKHSNELFVSIKNERENFQNLFSKTPEMFCVLDGPNHVFEFVNDAHIKALGFDATGKSVREAQPESVEVYSILDRVYKTGESAELREIPVTVGTHLRYFNLTYSARKDSLGNIHGVMILGTEITEQFLNREILKSQNKALEMTMNGAALEDVLNVLALSIENHLSLGVLCSILLLDSDGVHLRHGAAPSLSAEYNNKINGVEIGPNVGSCGSAAYFKKEVIVDDIATDPLWENFKDLALEHNLKSCWSKPIFSSTGEVIGTFALYNRLFNDLNSYEHQILNLITRTVSIVMEREVGNKKRISTEKALYESEKLYHATDEQLNMAIDVAKVGFYDWDIVNNKLNLSKQMLIDWGINENVIRLEDVLLYIHKDERERVTELIQATMERDDPYHTQYRVIQEDNTYEWMEVRGKVQRDETGRAIRFLGTSVKVTEQKEKEFSLERAQVAAEKASTAKGIFLANMSHEIRTPLGAIMGFINLLKNPSNSDDEINEYVGIIERSSKQLLRIVDDILDLSKIEAGKFSIDPIEFSLVELLNDFSSLMAFKAREKGLEYEMKIETGIPDWVSGDPTRFRQILSNLMGNAIKFTDKGYVYLRISFLKDENSLKIDIEDTGCGISKNARVNLFEPFSQGDNSTTRIYGGTGLGLNLSKRLSEAMGGCFYLKQSEKGVGTIFTTILPFKLLPKTKMIDTINLDKSLKLKPVNKPRTLPSLDILVVEDAIENRRLIKILLESWGINVTLAENGAEGVMKAKSGKFDKVLMDIQMPVMDGHEATKILRESGANYPIIALTAHALNEERQKCLKSGFTDFLSKPIDQEVLFEMLSEDN